jgi:hypothetical protein
MASHAAASPDTPGDEQEKRNNPDIEMTERSAHSPVAAMAENNAGSLGEANTAHAATSAQAQTHSDARPYRSRLDSTAIGPSIPVDEPVASLATSPSANPGLQVTLLLSQQGTKFTYKIDSRYLERRGVVLEGTDEEGRKDPLSVSIYTVKELLLREWREEEWGAKPQSPTSIRMIYFGRMLGDKDLLRGKCLGFPARMGGFFHFYVGIVHLNLSFRCGSVVVLMLRSIFLLGLRSVFFGVEIAHCFHAVVAPAVDVEIGRSSRSGHDPAFMHFYRWIYANWHNDRLPLQPQYKQHRTSHNQTTRLSRRRRGRAKANS